MERKSIMRITRREFIEQSATISAAALLGGAAAAEKAFGEPRARRHPNILLLMVDQQHMPPAYGPGEGMAQGLKEILGFQELSPDNPYTRFFPAFLRLRKNAVIFREHYSASSACVPSRTCIMTGRYNTGVDDTDGMLKTEHDVPWLDPDVPTIGDWFQAAGYTTHYFGKWHVSHPEAQNEDRPPDDQLDPDSLEPWGFTDWESSCPEPHGGGASNAGVYRDVRFADRVVEFLQQKEQDQSGRPWFAVGSLVNPHDVGLLPIPWGQPVGDGVVPWTYTAYPPPPNIPYQGQPSNEQNIPPDYQPLIVPLNPDGFPQNTFTLPPTFGEKLEDNNKPRCHYDYSLKFGLMAKASQENDFQPLLGESFQSAHPFQLQGEYASAWALAYGQFYLYCLYQADQQLYRMLQALDHASGLAENTIVIFLSDHGEMAGAHGGMIQKWHNAYQETIHVPMVISSPLVNGSESRMKEILQPTSSIDLAPTLLALAGYHPAALMAEMEALHGKANVIPFVGVDLSPYFKGQNAGRIHGPDGTPRTGVFYMTNDRITELGDHAPDDKKEDSSDFMDLVEDLRTQGYPLAPGAVTQPNCVRALCTGDWKIVHYVDPKRVEADEWELYCLATDPLEQTNLVAFETGEVRDDVTVPGLNKNQLRSINKQLRKELARQEALMLG